MMLPTEPMMPSRVSPKSMLLYSEPKAGKTTLLSYLPNSLILDLEDGAGFTKSIRVQIIGLRAPGRFPFDKELGIEVESEEAIKARQEKGKFYLSEVAVELNKLKKAGKIPYTFLVMDTVTVLEDWCVDQGTRDYMSIPVGSNFNRYTGPILSQRPELKGRVLPYSEWDSVLTLPKGGGYLYLREAFKRWLNFFSSLVDHVIWVGHLREKMIEKDGKEVSARDVDLTGKIRSITAQHCDAIAYLYRKNKEMYLTFEADEELLSGSRPKHLRGKVLHIADSNEEGDLEVVNWHTIYPDLLEQGENNMPIIKK